MIEEQRATVRVGMQRRRQLFGVPDSDCADSGHARLTVCHTARISTNRNARAHGRHARTHARTGTYLLIAGAEALPIGVAVCLPSADAAAAARAGVDFDIS